MFGLIKIINNGRCIRYRISFFSGLISEKYLEYLMGLEIMLIKNNNVTYLTFR